ncbi:MAG: adenylyl-sulfate kinase [Candidatus Thorarchaeota archaeon]
MVVTKNFLVCLAGLPASGKSTFAIKLKRIFETKFDTYKVKIVDPDIIRQSLSPNKFNYKFEPNVREKNLKEIKKEIIKGSIVISDDLNYYTSMRHDLKELADDNNIYFFIIYISTPLKTCLKWNRMRGKPIPNEIIKKINKKFDNFGKYSWDYPEAIYDISQIQDLNKEIEDFVENIKNEVSKSKKIYEKEDLSEEFFNLDNENLDKVTRIYVGKLFQNSEFIYLKKNIIKTRKLFIKLYKNKSLKGSEIVNTFKEFLEKKLNIVISEKLL